MQRSLRHYVTISQAATDKKTNRTTLHFAIARGELDYVHLGNRRIIVDNPKYQRWEVNEEFRRMRFGEPRKIAANKDKVQSL